MRGHISACPKRMGAHILLSSCLQVSGAFNKGQIPSLSGHGVPRETFKAAPSGPLAGPLAGTWRRGRPSLRVVSFLYRTSDLIPGTPELGMGLTQSGSFPERVDRLGTGNSSDRCWE